MAITSPGLASGLDIQGIVSKLVALERRPLVPLQQAAASFQSKLSVFGTVKSMVSALGDAANKLTGANAWNGVRATTTSDAVGVSARAGTSPTSMAIEVQNLARAQSNASAAVPNGSTMGSGTLSIQIGNWAGGSFAAGTAAAVPVTVAATDTLSDIATKINNADAGVSATVLRDASGERLLVRSSTTGEVNGFQITATDDDGNNTDAAGLSRLAYGGTSGAMHGMSLSQAGANAQATVNSVPISSATNTISDALPGITLNLNKVTTGPVEVSVLQDKDGIRKNLQAFVDAYNAINNMLVTATKYDPDTKTAGSLQGDSTAVGLQNALRRMMGSVTPGGDFQRLSDIGITIKTGGVMSIDNTKLDKAMENPAALQRLFANESSIATEKGFGFKVKAFADGITSDNGLVTTRTEGLRSAITRNGKEQDKINERATRAEARFLAQYNAMDAAVGQLSGLNAFVNQQVTLWNNQKR
jgi:flagellar hook-associated protein 2